MFSGYNAPEGKVTQVRDVALLPGERVIHVFSPDAGLMEGPPGDGQALVTTNQRIIAFSQEDGRNETSLVPMEELRGVVLKTAPRTSASPIQGLLLALGGLVLYVVVSYWLTARFDGPTVPLINMDIGPLMVLLIIIWGAVLVDRHYFVREENVVTFQGSNWVVTFPYRGEKAGKEIHQVVNTVFAARQSRNGYSFLWEE